MDTTDQFLEAPPTDPGIAEISESPTVVESTSVMELFPNFAEKDELTAKVKVRVANLFANCRDRDELEDIWDKNDLMFRVKPDASKDDVHRANESTGVFHISVNQLASIAFKTFTENPENYSYGYAGATDDEQTNIIRSKNAEIMTLLFRKAQRNSQFKKNLKRVLNDIYKNGNGFVGIPWEKQVVDLVYRDKSSGERKSKSQSLNNLPGLEFLPIDALWLDENIDDTEQQPAIYIKSPIAWNQLLADSKKNKVKLFTDEKGQEGLRNRFDGFRERLTSSEFNNAKMERYENADRTFTDRTGELYNHWVIWINLPISRESGEWDDNGEEIRCRVRIVGNPENCEIIEIRENIFPGGVPILAVHQTEDDVGMYHISLGEKVSTYFDQICIAIDQLIDNRSKNCRRPIVYDPMRIDIKKYDFGHSNGVPCTGDVRSAFAEMQIADMTATIMPTIQYFEQKIREIMNTTDAVMGQAMGGRTSASEYMGAKAAATTPIFSDMASIEDALIGEFMRRFAQYIHTFMTPEDMVEQVGVIGNEFQFDLTDIYTVELRGVAEAMDKMTKIQNLMQLFSMSQDATVKSRITLQIAKTMGMENPAQFAPTPAKDQAVKAALWENNEILVSALWDEPEQGELHDTHIPLHKQAMWMEQRNKNPNVQMMQQHISAHEQLKRSEQALAGGGSFPGSGGNGQSPDSLANLPPMPTEGEQSGQDISADMGNVQGGSQIPLAV